MESTLLSRTFSIPFYSSSLPFFYACQSPHSLHTCFSLLSSLKEDSVQVWIVVPIFILIVSCYFVVAPIIEAPSMEVITQYTYVEEG